MALVAAQGVSIGTGAAVKVAENLSPASGGDDRTRSFLILPQSASGVLSSGPAGVLAATGARWDVSKGALVAGLEPGEELWMIAVAGTIVVDILSGGR